MLSYNKEDFGYLVAFKEGKIGLYSEAAGPLCIQGASSEALDPYKLETLEITEDFHLHAPLVVWLEVTQRCNLRCEHCFMSASSLSGPSDSEMSTDKIFSLLDELKQQGVLSLVLTGGEPFVRSDFLEILNYAASLGFVTAVVTNGLRLTRSIIDRIPKDNVRITVSLDNLHLGNGNGGGESLKLRFLKSRLLMMQEAGILCHAAATMTRQNLAALKQTFSWLTEHGIGFREIPFSPIGRGASCPDLQLTLTEVEDAAELWAMSMVMERDLQIARPITTFDQCYDFCFALVYMARACKGARFLGYIAGNGDFYPCTICVGAGAFKLGNVNATPFKELWEESAKSFRQLSRWDNFKDCGGCSLSGEGYFCTNRCPPMSLKHHGSPCHCGASPYDRASIKYRTRHLSDLDALIDSSRSEPTRALARERQP